MTRYRTDLVEARTAEKQRVEKLLEDAQIKLSVVASDVFGVSGRDMMAALISGQRDPKALAAMARGRMRAKRPQLEEAFTGYFTDHHQLLLTKMLARIDAHVGDRFADQRLATMSGVHGSARATVGGSASAADAVVGDGAAGARGAASSFSSVSSFSPVCAGARPGPAGAAVAALAAGVALAIAIPLLPTPPGPPLPPMPVVLLPPRPGWWRSEPDQRPIQVVTVGSRLGVRWRGETGGGLGAGGSGPWASAGSLLSVDLMGFAVDFCAAAALHRRAQSQASVAGPQSGNSAADRFPPSGRSDRGVVIHSGGL